MWAFAVALVIIFKKQCKVVFKPKLKNWPTIRSKMKSRCAGKKMQCLVQPHSYSAQ